MRQLYGCKSTSQLLNMKMLFVYFVKRDQQQNAGLLGHKHTIAVHALNAWLTFYTFVAPHLLFLRLQRLQRRLGRVEQ